MEDDELLESEDQLLLEDEELIISLAKIHSKSHPSTQKGNFPDPSFRFSAQSQSKHNLFAKHLFQQIDKFSILISHPAASDPHQPSPKGAFSDVGMKLRCDSAIPIASALSPNH